MGADSRIGTAAARRPSPSSANASRPCSRGILSASESCRLAQCRSWLSAWSATSRGKASMCPTREASSTCPRRNWARSVSSAPAPSRFEQPRIRRHSRRRCSVKSGQSIRTRRSRRSERSRASSKDRSPSAKCRRDSSRHSPGWRSSWRRLASMACSPSS